MTTNPTDDRTHWPRPEDRRRVHWEIERSLREELLAAPERDREAVTTAVYNKLFAQVPWHDANVAEELNGVAEAAREAHWFRLYGPLTKPSDVLVDLGCGGGGLVREFAPAVRECIGVDASDVMVESADEDRPRNARFVVGSVIEPPLDPGSADFVITRQVVEHLHPDDIRRHLGAVLRILRPGGRYLVETPSRLTGPWDISRGFTDEATGFHLKEYTNADLGGLLRESGFRRVRGAALPSRLQARLPPAMSRSAYVPVVAKAAIERMLSRVPVSTRRRLAGPLGVREVALLAERPADSAL